MDSITQALIGANAAQAVFRRQLLYVAIIGLIAGTIPDLDVLIRANGNPLAMAIYHRQFTHSLIFIPIGGAITAGLFLLILRRLRTQWFRVYLVATAAYATHGILDACTSYGTQLFWPFSDVRISWDIISIVDPVFTMILLLGFTAAIIYKSATPARIALLCCLAYLGFATIQHHRAVTTLMRIAPTSATHIRAMPNLATLFYWRGFYLNDGELVIDAIHTPILSQSSSQPLYRFKTFNIHDLPAALQHQPQVIHALKTFAWFASNYLVATQNYPLTIVDARYILNNDRTLWGLSFVPTNEGVKITALRRPLIPKKLNLVNQE